MDHAIAPTLHWACNYLPMLRLTSMNICKESSVATSVIGDLINVFAKLVYG